MSAIGDTERVQVVVIGAGQAGLSVGYHLARKGVRFVILEAKARIGDSWRERWDSLRLFTPGSLDGLDGMPFPAPRHRFPTKDEMADYLEAYAARFALPVRTGVRVTGRPGRVTATSSRRATSASRRTTSWSRWRPIRSPGFPGSPASWAREVRQLHSLEYRRPSQLQPGGVLVVGAGNSGSGDRPGGGAQRASHLALGPRHRQGTVPDRLAAVAPRARAAAAPGDFPSAADGGHADGPQGAAQGDLGRRAADPDLAQGPCRRRRAAGAPGPPASATAGRCWRTAPCST